MDRIICEAVNRFETIRLEESGKVNFLKRQDFKYLASEEQLLRVLETIRPDYFVMTVCGEGVQGYRTTYFDTPEDDFYTQHHNGHNNRLKVRKREYLNTGAHFLEVKLKKINGNTSKKRTHIDSATNAPVDDTDREFLGKYVHDSISGLTPKIDTHFRRVTLVSKQFDERVTIDIDLDFKDYNGGTLQTRDLFIVEVKCNKSTGFTPIRKALKDQCVRSGGFSKYCIGRAVLDQTLRQNNFKYKVNLLKKYC